MLVPVLMALHAPKQALCSSEHSRHTCSLHVPEGAIGTQITAPEVIPTRVPALNTMQTPSQPYRLCGSVALIMNLFFFPLCSYPRIALVTNRQASTVVPHFPHTVPWVCPPHLWRPEQERAGDRDPQEPANESTVPGVNTRWH